MMKIKYFLLLSLVGFLSACGDDNEPRVDDSEEIGLFLSSSVATETFGLNSLISTSRNFQDNIIGGRANICDFTQSAETTINNEPTSEVEYTYEYAYDVSVNCDFQIPTGLNVDFTYEGSFEGPELTWSHEGMGDFIITQNNAETLAYNGTYERSGEFALKNFDRDGSSNVQISLSDVIVSPEENIIISGSGTFEIEVVRTARSYTASGTITFNGDNTATLNFDNNTITFNIVNGNRS